MRIKELSRRDQGPVRQMRKHFLSDFEPPVVRTRLPGSGRKYFMAKLESLCSEVILEPDQSRIFMLHESRRLREIAGIMEKADLGVVPKRKDNFGNEAFSTKIFEFMAMRVPVIVSIPESIATASTTPWCASSKVAMRTTWLVACSI